MGREGRQGGLARHRSVARGAMGRGGTRCSLADGRCELQDIEGRPNGSCNTSECCKGMRQDEDEEGLRGSDLAIHRSVAKGATGRGRNGSCKMGRRGREGMILQDIGVLQEVRDKMGRESCKSLGTRCGGSDLAIHRSVARGATGRGRDDLARRESDVMVSLA
jgi:hypothetical protein